MVPQVRVPPRMHVKRQEPVVNRRGLIGALLFFGVYLAAHGVHHWLSILLIGG